LRRHAAHGCFGDANGLGVGAESAAEDVRTRLERRGWRGGSDDAGEFGAEDEGGLYVAFVVLVQALGVEEIDVCYGGMGDFNCEFIS